LSGSGVEDTDIVPNPEGVNMPTPPIGAPCWVDLMTSDTERSRAFYSELFGWTAEDPNAEFGGYFNFTKDGVLVAGCMASQPDAGMPDVWSVYLATDDARKTVDAAAGEGGQVMVAAMDVADLGTMAVVGDPGGAVIGVWQPGRHQGFGISGQPGTPSWFELHTRDYDAALDFYRNVFRWDTHAISDTPEFRYTTLRDGESWLAGVMDASGFLPDGVPAHWSVYFGVDDTDAALAKIVDLGGSIVMPAEDTPYGRLAAAADPTGARFKLVAPNEAMPSSSSKSD
jgi:predicted enzyme related to lactoylglutathione lyase